MLSATVLFVKGWVLRQHQPGVPDPVTGEPRAGGFREVPGTGLLQEPYWSSVKETGVQGVVDERLVMFAPADGAVDTLRVESQDEFVSPTGEVWQATSDGHKRGIPTKKPEYVAVRVRRAKEKE